MTQEQQAVRIATATQTIPVIRKTVNVEDLGRALEALNHEMLGCYDPSMFTKGVMPWPSHMHPRVSSSVAGNKFRLLATPQPTIHQDPVRQHAHEGLRLLKEAFAQMVGTVEGTRTELENRIEGYLKMVQP